MSSTDSALLWVAWIIGASLFPLFPNATLGALLLGPPVGWVLYRLVLVAQRLYRWLGRTP